jgi:GT2 family glycosyltransferase
MKDLSIIVVNWNTRDLLAPCLQSVYETAGGLEFEVFVVDNASTDGSAQMVRERFPQLHLIENRENVGFARANNQAIRQSQACPARYTLRRWRRWLSSWRGIPRPAGAGRDCSTPTAACRSHAIPC